MQSCLSCYHWLLLAVTPTIFCIVSFRSSVRTPEGYLSPGMFNPTPRPPLNNAPARFSSEGPGLSGLPPGLDPSSMFKMVYRYEACF
jgi:hypothetical protein